MTVVLMATKSDYTDGNSLEVFARRLFNHWGVGDASRNDGVMVLVLQDDREMRIELGLAYKQNWNVAAERVIERHFIPAFASGNYPRGIRVGTNAVIGKIVLPFLDGAAAPQPKGNTNDDLPLYVILGGMVLVMLFKARRWIGDLMIRLRSCPNCQSKTLGQKRTILHQATRYSYGSGVHRIWCTTCDHKSEEGYLVPMLSTPSDSSGGSGGFGGGGSSGGGRSGGRGASGRW